MGELSAAVFPFFKEDVGEETLPVVTTGFWWEEDGTYSRDSTEDWLEHGGHILEAQMMNFNNAMEYYENIYNMGAKRAGLVARIYHERLLEPEKDIILKPEEVAVIRETGADNLEVCREVFGSFGVFSDGRSNEILF